MGNKTVYLLRHGKIAVEGEQRRYIGQIDLPLDFEGKRQAERLQARLEQISFTVIYCSDLIRSQETANILAGKTQARVEVRPQLREINLGEWEGLTFDEVARKFPDKFATRGKDIAYYRNPGGESFADCSNRVLKVFQDILAEAEDLVVIAGHAGVNRLILCHVLGIPLANLFRIGQDYGCINVIQYAGAGSQVKLINSVSR